MPKIIGGAVVTAVAAASVAGAAISSAKAGRAATKGNIDAANTKDARSMAAEEEGEVCCCWADAGRELDSWHLVYTKIEVKIHTYLASVIVYKLLAKTKCLPASQASAFGSTSHPHAWGRYFHFQSGLHVILADLKLI